MSYNYIVIPILLYVLSFKLVVTLNNGLALTPPMGWMSWERYRCITDCDMFPDDCISEKLFRNMADLLVSEGYLDVGYEYIIIDDCWLEKKRDKNGRLQPDKKRFPSGIKALADYVHSKGLKFGIYEDFGNFTCAGYPGIIDHLEIDAQTFADWDVDYVKLDGCHVDIEEMAYGYPEFGRLLNATNRPMVYSCSWPAYTEPKGIEGDYETLSEYCNLWRNWDDIEDSWESVTNITDWFANAQDRIANYSGPGHWNDPDMLIIGNFGLSYEQSKSQMAIWAIMAAPLIMSNDLKNVRPEFKEILQNKEIIAINQDSLGIQGKRVFKDKKKIEIWTKPITPIVNGYHSYAIAIQSRRIDGRPYPALVNLTSLGLNNPDGYFIKDLYDTNRNVPQTSVFNVTVFPSGVVFLHALSLDTKLKA